MNDPDYLLYAYFIRPYPFFFHIYEQKTEKSGKMLLPGKIIIFDKKTEKTLHRIQYRPESEKSH